MLSKILPNELLNTIKSNYSISAVTEIRLRRNLPICICVGGEFVELKSCADGKVLYSDKRLIDYIIMRATDASLYCYNNQLRNCYISTMGGIRIGVLGEVVLDENNNVKTIKNISSLNIRVPHQVLNCAKPILKFILQNKAVANCLIVSPPCAGKTTFVRDLARLLSSDRIIRNVLVVDERYEICSSGANGNQLDVGLYTDCISGSNKQFAFKEAVRSLRPDVIVCDELMTIEDSKAVEFAINSGVSVIATIHGSNVIELKRKSFLNKLIIEKYFNCYIFLSNANGVGTIDGVYDSNFQPIWK